MKTRMLVVGLGLVLLGSLSTARAYYDPGVQRWINRDPIGDGGFAMLNRLKATLSTRNLYEFVLNGPIRNHDSYGLETKIPVVFWRPCNTAELRSCQATCHPQPVLACGVGEQDGKVVESICACGTIIRPRPRCAPWWQRLLDSLFGEDGSGMVALL